LTLGGPNKSLLLERMGLSVMVLSVLVNGVLRKILAVLVVVVVK
jgi:hypothetical protein